MRLKRCCSVIVVFLMSSLFVVPIQAGPQDGNRLDYDATWIGNDFEYGPDVPDVSGQTVHDVHDIYVTDDGTVYTNVPWEERGSNVSGYRNGNWVVDARTGNHGGGRTVTANEKHLFFAGNRYRQGDPGIDRRPLADVDNKNKNEHVDCGTVHGLAADASRVYASVPEEDVVKVFTTDLEPVEKWSVRNPGEMCFGPQGNLWIIQRGSRRIVGYDPDGKRKTQIDLPDRANPTDVALSNRGWLMVADAGPAEQILFYDHLDGSPELVDRFGRRGGVFSGHEGRFRPGKLVNVHGVGMDRKGNIYVANRPGANGSTMLQSYRPDGTLNWQRECHVWIDVPSFHPEKPELLYGTDVRMRMDWSKPEGRQWDATAFTLNRRAFPDDPRVRTGGGHPSEGERGATYMRVLGNGTLYQFQIGMSGNILDVYRFDEAKHGSVAIWCGRVSTDTVWIDENANGRVDAPEKVEQETGTSRGLFVDTNGTIWLPSEKNGIYRYPLQGFTADGVPRYTKETRDHLEMPEPFTKLRRIYFYPERQNMMLLNGFTEKHPDRSHHWKRGGKVIRRYDRWRPGRWNLTWQRVPSFEDQKHGNSGDGNLQALDVAGEFLFLGRNGSSDELGVGRGHVDVYRLKTGEYVGWMEPPDAWGEIGIMDITNGMKAYRRRNGEYLVFFEDDWKSKTVMYRWTP